MTDTAIVYASLATLFTNGEAFDTTTIAARLQWARTERFGWNARTARTGSVSFPTRDKSTIPHCEAVERALEQVIQVAFYRNHWLTKGTQTRLRAWISKNANRVAGNLVMVQDAYGWNRMVHLVREEPARAA